MLVPFSYSALPHISSYPTTKIPYSFSPIFSLTLLSFFPPLFFCELLLPFAFSVIIAAEVSSFA
jgi:hypothetical protein